MGGAAGAGATGGPEMGATAETEIDEALAFFSLALFMTGANRGAGAGAGAADTGAGAGGKI